MAGLWAEDSVQEARVAFVKAEYGEPCSSMSLGGGLLCMGLLAALCRRRKVSSTSSM